jgi:bacterioferritin
MESANRIAGILDEDASDARDRIVAMLTRAYWMEVETVISYLAASINPDGVRAQEVIRSLEQDVGEELGHARQFGARIKELYGVVPGSQEFAPEQDFLQPPEDQRDIVAVIRGVIAAESGAIEHYNEIIAATEEVDPVTNDITIAILHDEERHRRLFEGFLREYRTGEPD